MINLVLNFNCCSRCMRQVPAKESKLCYFCNADDSLILKDADRICIEFAKQLHKSQR